MTVAYAESEDPSNLPLANEMLETLTYAYPGHSWWIRVDGGIVIIKHFDISGTVGMVKKFASLAHDATARKRDVINAAGELLERAHVRRGKRPDDLNVTVLEGGERFKWYKRRGLVH